MLTLIFNGLFHIGRFISGGGRFLQNAAIFLHMKFKTKTGKRIIAALESTKQQIQALQQQYLQEQGEGKNEFRSFFTGKKPGNS